MFDQLPDVIKMGVEQTKAAYTLERLPFPVGKINIVDNVTDESLRKLDEFKQAVQDNASEFDLGNTVDVSHFHSAEALYVRMNRALKNASQPEVIGMMADWEGIGGSTLSNIESTSAVIQHAGLKMCGNFFFSCAWGYTFLSFFFFFFFFSLAVHSSTNRREAHDGGFQNRVYARHKQRGLVRLQRGWTQQHGIQPRRRVRSRGDEGPVLPPNRLHDSVGPNLCDRPSSRGISRRLPLAARSLNLLSATCVFELDYPRGRRGFTGLQLEKVQALPLNETFCVLLAL